MNPILRGIVVLPALLLGSVGIQWLVTPESTAATLGMPLLDGLGRSTQIGDLAAFFLSIGIMMILAVVTLKREWFLAPAIILGLTALFRTLAWLFHDAAFATTEIAVEVIVAGLLLVCAWQLRSQSA